MSDFFSWVFLCVYVYLLGKHTHIFCFKGIVNRLILVGTFSAIESQWPDFKGRPLLGDFFFGKSIWYWLVFLLGGGWHFRPQITRGVTHWPETHVPFCGSPRSAVVYRTIISDTDRGWAGRASRAIASECKPWMGWLHCMNSLWVWLTVRHGIDGP